MFQESGLWLVGDRKRLETVSDEEDYRARILKRRPCSGTVKVESKRLGSADFKAPAVSWRELASEAGTLRGEKGSSYV